MTHLLSAARRLSAIQEPIPRFWSRAITAVTVLAVVLCYLHLSNIQHLVNPNDTTVPSLQQIWESGVVKLTEAHGREGTRTIVADTLATLRRLTVGFTLAVVGSMVLGVAAGAFDAARAALDPLFTFFSKTPAFAAYGIFFALFGTDENLYYALVVFAVLPTLAQAVSYAVRDFPEELRNKLHTLGAGTPDFLILMTRYSVPKIFDTLKLMIGQAIGMVIAAEVAVGEVGLGCTIRIQGRLLNISANIVYLILLGLFGLLLYRFVDWQRRIVCPETNMERES